MKNKTVEIKRIITNYGSESIDISLSTRNFLLENNFFKNSEKDNIKLLEQSLVEYSILKMADWNINIEQLGIENYDDLTQILKVLSDQIPTEKEKIEFFAQYTCCIIYFYSVIKKQEPIEWKKDVESLAQCNFISEDGNLKTFITNNEIQSYLIPISLLDKIKSYYPEKKDPILKK